MYGYIGTHICKCLTKSIEKWLHFICKKEAETIFSRIVQHVCKLCEAYDELLHLYSALYKTGYAAISNVELHLFAAQVFIQHDRAGQGISWQGRTGFILIGQGMAGQGMVRYVWVSEGQITHVHAFVDLKRCTCMSKCLSEIICGKHVGIGKENHPSGKYECIGHACDKKERISNTWYKYEPVYAYVLGSTNGTIGMPMPYRVLPLAPLVEPMVPILPTIGYQQCK